MARIPLEHPRTLSVRMMEWYSKRKVGKVAEPGLALLHNRKVLVALGLAEWRVEKWKSLDPTLALLAQMAPSATIGCSWCTDYGYYVAHHAGMDPAKIQDVPRWRDSDAYTDLERRVLEFAEATTETPPTVTDEMVAGLRERLSDEQLVELTALVALENQRSRINAALGLTSQGFKELCELRPA